jgi:hypothetical protein
MTGPQCRAYKDHGLKQSEDLGKEHLLRQQRRQQLHQHRVLVAVRLRLLLQLRAARLLLRRQLLADVQAGQVRRGVRVPHAVAAPQPRQVALLHRT